MFQQTVQKSRKFLEYAKGSHVCREQDVVIIRVQVTIISNLSFLTEYLKKFILCEVSTFLVYLTGKGHNFIRTHI